MSAIPDDVITEELTDSILTVCLNRPSQHNAFNPQLISKLSSFFIDLVDRDNVRIVILTGSGRSFSAGADLSSYKTESKISYQDALEKGEAIYDLMSAVNSCPHPLIGRINGSAIGGGMGLVSCCDITVSVDRAKFGFSETRLGLIPAVISPFVLNKISLGWARELFLTGELIKADFAKEIGLINHVVSEEELDETIRRQVQKLLMAAPKAQQTAKRLLRRITIEEDRNMRKRTTELFAERWLSKEAREGISAFLQKRKPNWQ